MTPKKRTTKKEAAPAPLPPVEMSAAAPKAKKAAKAPAPKVDASAAPKCAAPKMIKAAHPKVIKAAKTTKTAKPMEVEVRIAAPTSIAAEDPVQPARRAIRVEDIRHAAFNLSQSRRGPSDPVADWCEAERMLVARSS